MTLPPIAPLALIAERLQVIFPDGTAHRTYVVREMAVKTVYVMLYAGAIEGSGRWARPSQVTDMTDAQSLLTDDASRQAWISSSLSSSKTLPQNTWYKANSREPIRDETLRSGFIPCRAVIERAGIPTTSSKPRYALNAKFAALFDVELIGEALTAACIDWQDKHLSKSALARVRLVQQGASISKDAVTVRFPNGETRSLKPGPSSHISKAAIEVFAPKFLKHPTVLWLSESGNKVVAQDLSLAATLGLKIDASKALPDLILVDLGLNPDGSELMVVFTEVVATDGPIDYSRKATLTKLALDAHISERQLAFVTAYQDRGGAAFKKTIPELAWGTYAWCASEPDHLIDLRDGTPFKLSELMFPRSGT